MRPHRARQEIVMDVLDAMVIKGKTKTSTIANTCKINFTTSRSILIKMEERGWVKQGDDESWKATTEGKKAYERLSTGMQMIRSLDVSDL